jgi:membrane protein required for colicin V production
MEATSFNWIDYIILGIFLLSALSGLMRGGVREIISLLTWIAAFFIASLFAAPLATHFSNSDKVQSLVSSASSSVVEATSTHASLFALGVSFVLLFLATLLVGAIIGYVANSAVESGGISIINRLIGVLCGLGRGFLVNLVLIFVVQLTPVAKQPIWTDSTLVSAYQPTVTWIGNIVQPGMEAMKSKMGKTLEDFGTSVQSKAADVFQQTT